MLTEAAQKFVRQATNPFVYWFYLLWKLPAALFCGVRLHEIGPSRCVVSVPYGWRSQNPFKSTYFAAQAMAAEMSTGTLMLLGAANAGVPISTLIVDIQATFGKKATDRATFVCNGGEQALAAVREAEATGEARVVSLETVGTTADGTEVSRFVFTWSAKAKSRPLTSPATPASVPAAPPASP